MTSPTPCRPSCWDRSSDHPGRGLPAQCLQTFRHRSPHPYSAASSHPSSARNPKPTRESSFPHPTLALVTLPQPRVSWEPGQGPGCCSLPEAVQSCQHHVRGVQGVDEVGWEGVLLLHRVGLPAVQSGRQEELGHLRAQRDLGLSKGLTTWLTPSTGTPERRRSPGALALLGRLAVSPEHRLGTAGTQQRPRFHTYWLSLEVFRLRCCMPQFSCGEEHGMGCQLRCPASSRHPPPP